MHVCTHECKCYVTGTNECCYDCNLCCIGQCMMVDDDYCEFRKEYKEEDDNESFS